ncbi:MAG: hypothetical protein K2Y37_08820 [Pirellulales bacterium]|nr:hypothetical protein [Pirellulales bacterium]
MSEHQLPGDTSLPRDSAPGPGYDPARPDSGTRAMIIGDRPLPHEAHGDDHPLPDPEPAEVRIGPILAVGFGLLLVMVVGIFVTLEMVRRWGQRIADERPRPQGIFRETDPKAPLLQVGGRQSMTEMRQREHELLESYGWVDRERGIVRIPIEQAIDEYLAMSVAPAKDGAAPADDTARPAGTSPTSAPSGVPANGSNTPDKP